MRLLHRLDELYTEDPSAGSRRMAAILAREFDTALNRKRVQRLMRILGLVAISPRRRLSRPAPGHKIFPYLLNEVTIERPNHVWSTDITYIRMQSGFAYLTAVLDWFSRYVLSWELSPVADSNFCCAAVQSALGKGTVPEIFNTDQGAQFTSNDFVGLLQRHSVRISMDGRGRFLDNIFVERLWRTVKYEHVYLNDYQHLPELRIGLTAFFRRYNFHRPHQSLGYRTPAEVYFQQEK